MTVLVVDGANVVGSRPDGWWRDRAGAAARLATRLGAASAAGLLDPLGAPSRVVLVVEARRALPRWSRSRGSRCCALPPTATPRSSTSSASWSPG
ncbi:hypothetical protein ACFQV8_17970 [Pseudonocardia benzenivorans]